MIEVRGGTNIPGGLSEMGRGLSRDFAVVDVPSTLARYFPLNSWIIFQISTNVLRVYMTVMSTPTATTQLDPTHAHARKHILETEKDAQVIVSFAPITQMLILVIEQKPSVPALS